MAAYAEGYELLDEEGHRRRRARGAFKAWSRGTVVRSWLLDLMADAPRGEPDARGRLRLHQRLRRGAVDRRGGARACRCRCRSSPPRSSPGSRRGRSRPRRCRRSPPCAAVRRAPGDDRRRGREAARGGRRPASRAPTPPSARPRARRSRRRRGPRRPRPRRLTTAGPGLARTGRAERAGARPAPVGRRLPQLRLGRAAARSRGHDAGRAQRPGQDQPRRGHRLPRDALQPPGRDGCPARPLRCRASRRARCRRATGARERHRARDHARAGPTGPGSTGPRAGHGRCSARCAPCCSPPRTWPSSRATPPSGGGFLDELLVARQPRWAAVRQDYERIVRQRVGAAEVRPGAPVPARAAGPGPGRRRRPRGGRGGAAHPRRSGTTRSPTSAAHLLYARLRLLRDLGPYLGKAYDEVSAGAVRRPGRVPVLAA